MNIPQEEKSTVLTRWAYHVQKMQGFKCQICRTNKDVRSYHIIPIAARRFPYFERNGIALCDSCYQISLLRKDGDEID